MVHSEAHRRVAETVEKNDGQSAVLAYHFARAYTFLRDRLSPDAHLAAVLSEYRAAGASTSGRNGRGGVP